MEMHFVYCDEEMRKFWNRNDLYLSEKFCRFFAKRFEEFFCTKTGIKPSFKVSLAGSKQQNDIPMYLKGDVSKINLVLWIMPEFLHDISFCWKSKSGKIIATTDVEFDEEDVECWIEGLQPSLYWQQIATEKKDHPFASKNLPFTLKVFGFGTDLSFTIILNNAINAEVIVKKVAETIEKYNNDSEAKERANGVVHNYSSKVDADKVEFRIDTGSAGIRIINKILNAIKKTKEINEVIIDY